MATKIIVAMLIEIDRIEKNYALRIRPNNKEITARIIRICIKPVAFQ